MFELICPHCGGDKRMVKIIPALDFRRCKECGMGFWTIGDTIYEQNPHGRR